MLNHRDKDKQTPFLSLAVIPSYFSSSKPTGFSQGVRVTRLGKILPFGQFFMALGKFFSGKNRPMIWAKF
jgi:hypothetical protein